jgi:cation diffusion facilitator family transporter
VLALKFTAWRLTGSVALYSDALESLVNIAAAAALMVALRVAAQPPDRNHPYGHGKAEYFSAAFEGTLIAVAAAAIVHQAWGRLWAPTPLGRLDVGLTVSLLATGINGGVAAWLLALARRQRSPALRADALHLFTDVATSVGVLVGTGIAGATRIWILDPVLAGLVALNILRVGAGLMRDSVRGLMDEAVPDEERAQMEQVIGEALDPGMAFDALRTRRAAERTFVALRLLVPPTMTVRAAHDVCDRVEARVGALVPDADVDIHVEPRGEVPESRPPG